MALRPAQVARCAGRSHDELQSDGVNCYVAKCLTRDAVVACASSGWAIAYDDRTPSQRISSGLGSRTRVSASNWAGRPRTDTEYKRGTPTRPTEARHGLDGL